MMLAYQPIRSLATINMAAYQGATAFKRISNIIDQEIKIKNERDLPSLQINKTNINFDKVGFQYTTTKSKAIKNINIDIQGGSMSAFVGHSGAEKVQLLIFFQDFMTRKKAKSQLIIRYKKSFAEFIKKKYIFSKPDIILFDDTVRNNIGYANTAAS